MARKIRFGLAALIGLFVALLITDQAFAVIDVSSPKYEEPVVDSVSVGTGASADGSSSVKVGESVWTRAKKNIGVGFFNFANVNMEQANDAYGQISNYSYFNFDYKFDRTRKLSVRPVFLWSTAGANNRGEYKPGDLALGDAFVNYIDYNFLPVPWDMEFAAQWRVYAPTSEASSSKGMITRIRPWFILSRDFTRDFTVKVNFEPDYYVQSRTGYVTDKGKVNGNKNWGYESSIEFDYSFSRRFGAQISLGYEEMSAHTVPSEGVYDVYHTEGSSVEASLTATFGRLFVVTGLSQSHQTVRAYNQFALFRGEETDYYLLTSYRF